jgi:hypothetical protein
MLNRGKSIKALSKKKLQKFQDEADSHGVVYLSRIPPYMQPQKIRYLLSPYGEVMRIFLTPEGIILKHQLVHLQISFNSITFLICCFLFDQMLPLLASERSWRRKVERTLLKAGWSSLTRRLPSLSLLPSTIHLLV